MSKSKKPVIESEVWYSLTDFTNLGILPWLGSDIRRYRMIVARDRKSKNILEAIILGRKKRKRYLLKGENIIKFKNAIESGAITL